MQISVAKKIFIIRCGSTIIEVKIVNLDIPIFILVMMNPNQHSHRISILFTDYLQGHLVLKELIEKLSAIESLHKQNHNDTESEKTLWFKFSKDDSLVTTIDDLQKDLSNQNREFTLQRIREALNVDQELSIYYS